jgi:tetratricopeptide (TPR) repeat protein
MNGRNVAREDGAASTHPLAYVRRRHGWSYQDVARVIADHARALGVPMAARREKVWRWEHWGVVPEADSQRALARALGIPAGELESRPWPRWLPGHGGVPDGLPWTTEGSRTALASLLDDGGDPRGLPAADGRALVDLIAEWGAARAEGAVEAPGARVPAQATASADRRTADATAAPAAVDGPVVEWLEAGVLGLRRLDDRLGGAAVRHRVEADLRLVSGLLARGSHRGATRARLLRIAADLAQLGGWAATDAGRHGAARRHFVTGLRLAHSAPDRDMAVSVWSGLALQAVVAGRPQDASAAAQAAVRTAAGAGPAVRALAACRLARAHAALGAESAFRRAADEAERQLDASKGDPGPAWLYWLDHAELTAQAGQSLLQLARADEAGPLLEKALAVQDGSFLRDRALYSVRAAQARLLAGDPEGARALGREAARLSRLCGSPRPADALDELRADLHGRG